jgi:hypothetical protein
MDLIAIDICGHMACCLVMSRSLLKTAIYSGREDSTLTVCRTNEAEPVANVLDTFYLRYPFLQQPRHL